MNFNVNYESWGMVIKDFLQKNQKAAKAMERLAEFKKEGYPLIAEDLTPAKNSNEKKKGKIRNRLPN
ncbi:hypothetical protein P5704_024625 (plasmid) [Pseudomonas sp. FeN3W]|nr:hypothetical protein P5704_024625 [Pseudomonas sp. FeN3W]